MKNTTRNPVAPFTIDRLKKGAVVLLPIFLVIGCFHFFFPYLKTSYISARTGLSSYSRSGIQVYAANKELQEIVVNTYSRFRKKFEEKYGDILDFSKVPPGRILIFQNSEPFEEYFSAKWQENLPNNSGYYDPTSGEIAIVNPGRKSLLRRAIRHEATHLFLRNAAPGGNRNWSPWFDEGFASVYEHMYRMSDEEDRLGGFDREALLHLLHSLSGHSSNSPGSSSDWIPLKDLIRAEHVRFRSNMNRQYYYQSKATVFFLMRNRPEQFRELFIREATSSNVGPEVVESILDQDLSELDQEIREWLQSLHVRGDLLTLEGRWIRYIEGAE